MSDTYLRSIDNQVKVPSHLKSFPVALSSNRIVDIIDTVSKKKREDYCMSTSKANHMNAGKENLHVRRKGHLKMLSSSDNIIYCRFCQNNGEGEEVFLSHATKEHNGTVVCPKLREYTCPVCDQTGDRAHTVRYCPKIRGSKADKANENSSIPTLIPGHSTKVRRNNYL